MQERIEIRDGKTFKVTTLSPDPRSRPSAAKRRGKRNTSKPCPRCKRVVVPWKVAKNSKGRALCGECMRADADAKHISSLVE